MKKITITLKESLEEFDFEDTLASVISKLQALAEKYKDYENVHINGNWKYDDYRLSLMGSRPETSKERKIRLEKLKKVEELKDKKRLADFNRLKKYFEKKDADI